MDVFIAVDWLRQRITGERGTGDDTPQHASLVLLDVRWALGDPHGRGHYLAGHLPGAVYVDLDTELAGPPSAAAGRHPLPGVAQLQDAARRWGIRAGSQIVVYDDSAGLAAARAWWLLRWAGVTQVSILDGGLGAWRAAGLVLDSGDVQPTRGDIVLTPGRLPVVDADQAAELASGARSVLVDARSPERYRGEVEPMDPRAGHIPAAVNAPTTENVDSDGRLLAAPSLSARFAQLGIRPGAPTCVYCGSGVTAAHQIAALASIGVPAALYPGSWSQWSADPSRAVAVGPAP